MTTQSNLFRAVAATAAMLSANPIGAQAVRGDIGFQAALLPQGISGFVNNVPLPFAAQFFGNGGGSIGINEDGYITFGLMTESVGAMGLFISPLNADFDNRPDVGIPVSYGADVVGGRAAFGINWLSMLQYHPEADEPPTGRTSFQLVLIDRSDVAAGDFDFEFNYDAVELPDIGFLAGYGEGCLYAPGDPSCPPGMPAQIDVHPDGAPGATVLGSLNSPVAGRYRYGVRGGVVITTGLDPDEVGVVPEPTSLSLALLGLGVLGSVAVRTRRRR